VIDAALADIDAAAERTRAEQLVRDKLRREKLGDPGDRDAENNVARRLVGMLARRGYHQSMALDVVTTELANERERRKV
ncbi:recombination regulator RecX, partial [Mycobacterium sp. ITM-2017-0098]